VVERLGVDELRDQDRIGDVLSVEIRRCRGDRQIWHIKRIWPAGDRHADADQPARALPEAAMDCAREVHVHDAVRDRRETHGAHPAIDELVARVRAVVPVE
jgi:hypothetical protein